MCTCTGLSNNFLTATHPFRCLVSVDFFRSESKVELDILQSQKDESFKHRLSDKDSFQGLALLL